jgi:hypothetical protein
MGRTSTSFTAETGKDARQRQLTSKGVSRNSKRLLTSKRRKRLEDAVWWVYKHSVDDEPPSEYERLWQDVKRADPAAFGKQVLLAVLPPPPKEQPLPKAEEVKSREEEWGCYAELVEQMFRECVDEEQPNNPSNTLHVSQADPSKPIACGQSDP